MAKTPQERLTEAQKALEDAKARADNPKIPLSKQRQCRDTVRHLTGEVERLEREVGNAPAPSEPVAPEFRTLGRALLAFGLI